MTDTNTSSSNPLTPNPETVALVAMLLRYVLAIVSGFGLWHGSVDSSMLSLLAGGLVGIATVVWALWERFRTARKSHDDAAASAVASANATMVNGVASPVLVKL